MRDTVKALTIRAVAPLAAAISWFDRSVGRGLRIASLREAGVSTPDSAVILGPVRVHGRGDARIGERLLSYGDLVIELQEGASLTVGSDVVFARGVHLAANGDLTIGDRSMIGELTSVRTASHRHGDGVQPRFTEDVAAPVTIGDDVWIGRGVAVMPGVSIGDGAVVGANAVVTRDVDPGVVVAGVPARPLKSS